MSTPLPRHKQQIFPVTFDFAAATADSLANQVYKALTDLEVVKAEVLSVTGLAAHATAYFTITIKNGATVIATWSTLLGAEGTLTANTFMAMTLAAAISDRRALEGDVLTLSLDETGDTTLPAGRVVLHCRQRSAV